MNDNSKCVFCQIVSKEIPAEIIAESDKILCFKDLNPQAKLHVLAIPKEHYADVTELTQEPELLSSIVKIAQEIATKHADSSFKLLFNTGAKAGQSVFHAHAHILSGFSSNAEIPL